MADDDGTDAGNTSKAAPTYDVNVQDALDQAILAENLPVAHRNFLLGLKRTQTTMSTGLSQRGMSSGYFDAVGVVHNIKYQHYQTSRLLSVTIGLFHPLNDPEYFKATDHIQCKIDSANPDRFWASMEVKTGGDAQVVPEPAPTGRGKKAKRKLYQISQTVRFESGLNERFTVDWWPRKTPFPMRPKAPSGKTGAEIETGDIVRVLGCRPKMDPKWGLKIEARSVEFYSYAVDLAGAAANHYARYLNHLAHMQPDFVPMEFDPKFDKGEAEKETQRREKLRSDREEERKARAEAATASGGTDAPAPFVPASATVPHSVATKIAETLEEEVAHSVDEHLPSTAKSDAAAGAVARNQGSASAALLAAMPKALGVAAPAAPGTDAVAPSPKVAPMATEEERASRSAAVAAALSQEERKRYKALVMKPESRDFYYKHGNGDLCVPLHGTTAKQLVAMASLQVNCTVFDAPVIDPRDDNSFVRGYLNTDEASKKTETRALPQVCYVISGQQLSLVGLTEDQLADRKKYVKDIVIRHIIYWKSLAAFGIVETPNIEGLSFGPATEERTRRALQITVLPTMLTRAFGVTVSYIDYWRSCQPGVTALPYDVYYETAGTTNKLTYKAGTKDAGAILQQGPPNVEYTRGSGLNNCLLIDLALTVIGCALPVSMAHIREFIQYKVERTSKNPKLAKRFNLNMSLAVTPCIDANPLNGTKYSHIVNVLECDQDFSLDVAKLEEIWTGWFVPERASPDLNKALQVDVELDEEDPETKMKKKVKRPSPLLKYIKEHTYEENIKLCQEIVRKGHTDYAEDFDVEGISIHIGGVAPIRIVDAKKKETFVFKPYLDGVYFAIKKEYLKGRGLYGYCADHPEEKVLDFTVRHVAHPVKKLALDVGGADSSATNTNGLPSSTTLVASKPADGAAEEVNPAAAPSPIPRTGGEADVAHDISKGPPYTQDSDVEMSPPNAGQAPSPLQEESHGSDTQQGGEPAQIGTEEEEAARATAEAEEAERRRAKRQARKARKASMSLAEKEEGDPEEAEDAEGVAS